MGLSTPSNWSNRLDTTSVIARRAKPDEAIALTLIVIASDWSKPKPRAEGVVGGNRLYGFSFFLLSFNGG